MQKMNEHIQIIFFSSGISTYLFLFFFWHRWLLGEVMLRLITRFHKISSMSTTLLFTHTKKNDTHMTHDT